MGKVYLYVLNTLSDWEIGFLTAEINTGRYFKKGVEKPELIKVGNGLSSIVTMGGMLISPEQDIAKVDFTEGDILILPGADTWLNEENQKMLDMVEGLLEKKVVIAGICGATIGLASKGVLNERKHTSNDKGFLKMICKEYSGEDLYLEDPALRDGNLITATGIAPLDFTYQVLKVMDVMSDRTLEAWYNLYNSKDSKFFYELLESIKD